MTKEEMEKEFEEWYRKENELTPDEPIRWTNQYLYFYQRKGYLQASQKGEEKIEKLREAVGYAIHEIIASGLYFDHPTIIRLSKALEAK